MLTRKQYELLLFIDSRLKTCGVSPSFDEMKEALGLRSKSGIHRLMTGLEERGFVRRLPHRARALEVLRLPENLHHAADGPGESELAVATPSGPPSGIAASSIPQSSLPSASVPPASIQATPISAPPPCVAARRGEGFTPNVIKGEFKLTGQPAAPSSSIVPLPLYGKIAAGTPIAALRDQSRSIDVPSVLVGRGDHYALEVEGDSMIEAGILDGDTVIIQRTDTADSGTIVVALVDDEEVTLKRLRRRGQSIALEPANPAYEVRICGPDQVRVQGRLVGLLRRY